MSWADLLKSIVCVLNLIALILLLVQILNLAIWTYLLVRSHGRSL